MMVMTNTDSIWTYEDFTGLETGAVSKALSRLTKEGLLRRLRKGMYYRPKQTIIGESRVSSVALGAKLLSSGARPTGITAAQALGLTNQVPAIPSFAISKNDAPVNLPGIRVTVRRPPIGERMNACEVAVLEVLRDRGETSELSKEETIYRLTQILRKRSVFNRIAKSAINEPPRVRAILGALGQEASIQNTAIDNLRKSLNGLSRFDFGLFKDLPSAKEWQSK